MQITDGIDWGSLSFYAGLTGDGLVGLWDGTGELREVSELRADPEAPVALLAELEPWGEGWAEPDGLAAFVVETAEGNVLSFRGGTYAVPSGRLRKAVREPRLRPTAVLRAAGRRPARGRAGVLRVFRTRNVRRTS